ncbi:MAG: MATE family efflux transporter, partial [Phenylobacterium sp.]|nr:MATE family efflux transporter [Phenylobacterium sp.]
MTRPVSPESSPTPGRHLLVRQDLRRLLRLSGPVVLARLGIMTMGLMDAIVVGRYSAVELGFHAMA